MIDLLLAGLGRPNGLDAEVNAIAAHALLTAPPSTLIDAARASAAERLENFRIPIWAATLAAQIVVLAWFWSTGRSARLRDWLRARTPSEFAARFLFGAVLALVDRLAAFIPQAVQYRFMRLMNLNEFLFRTWLAHWIAGTLVTLVVAGTAAAIVLWLADRTHQWYLYTILGVVGFTLLVTYVTPSFIAPVGTSYSAFVPAGKLRDDIAALERRTGTALPILEEHIAERTHAGRAYVAGWGGSQRIVISDTLIAGSTESELRFAIARSLEWVRANRGLQNALVQAAFLVVGTGLSVLVADRIGFRRDDDPVSRLALLGAVMGCVYVIAFPFYNGYARRSEIVTDVAALALTGDRAAFVRSEIRSADQSLQTLCPRKLAYWYLDDYPSVGERVALAQDRPNECSTRRP